MWVGRVVSASAEPYGSLGTCSGLATTYLLCGRFCLVRACRSRRCEHDIRFIEGNAASAYIFIYFIRCAGLPLMPERGYLLPVQPDANMGQGTKEGCLMNRVTGPRRWSSRCGKIVVSSDFELSESFAVACILPMNLWSSSWPSRMKRWRMLILWDHRQERS